MQIPRPHDLLWLNAHDALEDICESWVENQWRPTLPVVVRRDAEHNGRIPVGVRGANRSQRASGWVKAENITRIISPDTLSRHDFLLASPFISMSPVQCALRLANCEWPWEWGVTGSTGYALASGIPVLHPDSDLDLLIRSPQQLALEELWEWQTTIEQLGCRVDTQIETSRGAFALAEWLREGRILLKTDHGPILLSNPWSTEDDV